MKNDGLLGRHFAHVEDAKAEKRMGTDEHHSAEDWRAYFHATEHKTVFERTCHVSIHHHPDRPSSERGAKPVVDGEG